MPRPVGPGSVLRVVAPAGPFDAEAFELGASFLRTRYEVRHRPDVLERSGYLAGDDSRRLEELQEALADPDAVAIVAVRGGYGATRLLPHLGEDIVRASDKLLVGFSDITALHALWQRAGLPSIHGSMVAALGRAESEPRERWLASLEGGPRALEGLERWRGTSAEGTLVGGNLAVLAALVGTPFAPPLDGSLLLLEDVGERPYRLDRMLTTLRQAGWLERVAGVVVGDLERCHSGADGVEARDVFLERLGSLPIPVVAGAPVGHGSRNESLWLGTRYILDAEAGTLVPRPDPIAGSLAP